MPSRGSAATRLLLAFFGVDALLDANVLVPGILVSLPYMDMLDMQARSVTDQSSGFSAMKRSMSSLHRGSSSTTTSTPRERR